jgi:pyruvate,water dikinase
MPPKELLIQLNKIEKDTDMPVSKWIFEVGSEFAIDLKGELGGKGYQLAELVALRYPVPKFFIIKSSALDYFWEYNRLLLNKCNKLLVENKEFEPEKLEQLSSKIISLMFEGEVPLDLSQDILKYLEKTSSEAVAVRSSAVAEDGFSQSFAGMFDTYLNVSHDKVIDSIKNCWASQFTARSLVYDAGTSLTKITRSTFAVVVQKMIQSEISGVCFTVEPGSLDKNRMLIEAVWGLGEALVAGEVTPDSYIFNKHPLRMEENKIQEQTKKRVSNIDSGIQWASISSHRSRQPKLQGSILIELASLCKNLELTFEQACDIEWTIADNVIYILQCRPITVK